MGATKLPIIPSQMELWEALPRSNKPSLLARAELPGCFLHSYPHTHIYQRRAAMLATTTLQCTPLPVPPSAPTTGPSLTPSFCKPLSQPYACNFPWVLVTMCLTFDHKYFPFCVFKMHYANLKCYLCAR